MDSLTKKLMYQKGYEQALKDYTRILQDYYGYKDKQKAKEIKFVTESIKNKLQVELSRKE